jgi:hypothetical protein
MHNRLFALTSLAFASLVSGLAVADSAGPSTKPAPTASTAPTAPTAPTASTAATAPTSPRLSLLKDVASKKTALKDVIDPARGVTTISFIEALPGDDDKPTKEDIGSKHFCGPALTKELPALQAQIEDAVRRIADGEDATCTEQVCSVPGMEYQPSVYIYFAAAAKEGGAPSIEAVALISEAALGDEWIQRSQVHVKKSLDAARAKPCSGAKKSSKASTK